LRPRGGKHGEGTRLTTDRYSGDPRLLLTPNGADHDWEGGQPVMDRGLENQALISLFTRPGWCGNLFLPPGQRIGSDFEETCEGPITLQALAADIPQSAERALKSPLIPEVTVEVSNPTAWNLAIAISLGSGQTLTLDRRGMLWSNQASDPAAARLVKAES